MNASTHSLDPFDEAAVTAASRLLAHLSGDVLFCGDVTPPLLERLRRGVSPAVDVLSFRYDVLALFGEVPADPAAVLEDRDFRHLVVIQRKSKPRTLQVLAWLRGHVPEAEVVLIGHKKRGIKSMPRLLADYGVDTEKLGDANRCTAYALAWTPGALAEAARGAEGRIRYLEHEYVAMAGVFGSRGLDPGTELLLQALPPLKAGARLLDCGCGAGVLGLGQIESSTGSSLIALDADWFAVESARRNAKQRGLASRVGVEWGDTFPRQRSAFDRIVSNPPFHSGNAQSYEVARRLITDAPGWLSPQGELWVVANGFLPYREYFEASRLDWREAQRTPAYTVYHAAQRGA